MNLMVPNFIIFARIQILIDENKKRIKRYFIQAP